MVEYNKFNKNEISRPSEYHSDKAYKNLHEAALIAKNEIDYGRMFHRKYKKQRKDALEIIDYFSKTVNKFYTGTLTDEQYDFLLNSSTKKIIKHILTKKAPGLEEKIE